MMEESTGEDLSEIKDKIMKKQWDKYALFDMFWVVRFLVQRMKEVSNYENGYSTE